VTQSLEEMRAERDRLSAEIAKVEARARADWNESLNQCEIALHRLMPGSEGSGAYALKNRKNENIWDINGECGVVHVRFGYLQESWGPWLQVKAGAVSLGWATDAPVDVDSFIAIVAVLMRKTEVVK
jgi:hypothetical protein